MLRLLNIMGRVTYVARTYIDQQYLTYFDQLYVEPWFYLDLHILTSLDSRLSTRKKERERERR